MFTRLHSADTRGMNTAYTPEQILAAAADYNAPGPDADWTAEQLQAAIDHASPFVAVNASRGSRGGVKAVVYACIDDPSGEGAWACEEPRVVWLKDTDGRLSPAKIAERAARYIGVAGATVPVRYRRSGR
jgi:hypothetical protein